MRIKETTGPVPAKHEGGVAPRKRASGFRRVKKIDMMVFELGQDYKLSHVDFPFQLHFIEHRSRSFHLIVVMGCVHMEVSWRNT